MAEDENALEVLATRLGMNQSHTLAAIIIHIAENIYNNCMESESDIQNFKITDNLELTFTNLLWNTLYVNKRQGLMEYCLSKWGDNWKEYTGVNCCKVKAHCIRSGVSRK